MNMMMNYYLNYLTEYKAEDTKLTRSVALRFLLTNRHKPEDDKQRFLQEAEGV